jgi:formylglycine-generating enzyme required for sulfatase activity
VLATGKTAVLIASLCACAPTHPAPPPPVLLEIAPRSPEPAASTGEDEAADDPSVAGMIAIQAGTFTMGTAGCDSDEQPEHEVRLRGFYMDAMEVTVEAYMRCVHAGRCTPPEPPARHDPEDDEDDQERCNAGRPGRERHPMNCVTWIQADAYCRAQGKRLPTEEEWEFAARGPKGRAFPWGDTFDPGRVCWNRTDGTCPAGAHRAGDTPLGLADMAGNVWEWTASHYCSYGNPDCDDSGYVDRGGGWISDDPRLLHSAHRGRGEPDAAASYLGFRCARDR